METCKHTGCQKMSFKFNECRYENMDRRGKIRDRAKLIELVAVMRWMFLVLLVFIAMGCQESSEIKGQSLMTSYPLTDRDGDSLVVGVDEAKKNGVLHSLPLLMVGDTSFEVVKKLGYKPDIYRVAPSKSLRSKPHHLLMSYFFKNKTNNNDLLVVEEQSVVFIFSTDDKLESVIYSPVIQDVSGVSLPVLR